MQSSVEPSLASGSTIRGDEVRTRQLWFLSEHSGSATASSVFQRRTTSIPHPRLAEFSVSCFSGEQNAGDFAGSDGVSVGESFTIILSAPVHSRRQLRMREMDEFWENVVRVFR